MLITELDSYPFFDMFDKAIKHIKNIIPYTPGIEQGKNTMLRLLYIEDRHYCIEYGIKHYKIIGLINDKQRFELVYTKGKPVLLHNMIHTDFMFLYNYKTYRFDNSIKEYKLCDMELMTVHRIFRIILQDLYLILKEESGAIVTTNTHSYSDPEKTIILEQDGCVYVTDNRVKYTEPIL